MTAENMSWQIRAGLAAVCLLLLLKFGLFPIYDWQDKIFRQIKILQKSMAEKKALLGNETKINALIKEAEASYKDARRYYYKDFSDTQALQLMLQKKIEDLASTNGITLKSADWLYPSEGDMIQVPLKIRFEAQPVQLMAFISAIENDNHFLTVDLLRVISQSRLTTIFAEIDVSAYGVKE